MKTPSDELFNLIKSLSGQEKRAFKLFPQQKSAPLVCLKLFDAIDSLERYDEKKLLEILKKTGGINYIRQAKRHLHELILKFWEYHYFDYSVEIKLQRLLQRTEILFSKRLFSSAQKCIVKAEKMAIENHQHPYLLGILRWKRSIMVSVEKVASYREYEHQQYISELGSMEMYKNIVAYQKIDMQVGFIMTTQPTNIGSREKTELKKILKTPYLKNEKMALSPRAKAMYYLILGEINFLLKNTSESYTCFKQLVNYFDLAKLETREKLTAYARLATLLHELKKHDELRLVNNSVITLFKSLPKKLQTANLYSRYLSIRINYIDYQLSTFDIKEALSASDEIQNDVEKHASTQSFLVYYINKLLLYFFLPDYRKAMYCANKILTVEKKGVRRDIIVDTKVFYFVLYYELGNEILLPDLCRSAMRYYKQQKTQNHSAEIIIINFLNKITNKVYARADKIILFEKLKEELELYKSERIFSNFDFISWCDSKIQNRPMIEILKEKSLKVGKV